MDVEMIERVAEALYIADCIADKEPYDWKVLSQYSKDIYIDRSKAAIKAMRELSLNLIEAGDIQVEFDGSFELAWHKTIDSITND